MATTTPQTNYLMPQGQPTPYQGQMPTAQTQTVPGTSQTQGGQVGTMPISTSPTKQTLEQPMIGGYMPPNMTAPRTAAGEQPAPAVPPPTQAPPTGGIDWTKPLPGGLSGTIDQAKAGLQQAATSAGIQLSQEQWNQILAASGYTSGPVTSDHYNKALAQLQSFGKPQPTTPQPTTPPGQPAPGSIDNVGPGPAQGQLPGQQQAAGVPPTFSQANPFYNQQVGMIQGQLQNPHTMGQQFQTQLGEMQKESANRMLQQGNQQAAQRSVASGFGAGGANQASQQGQNQQQMVSDLLGGRRQIATQAAIQNRQDEFGALNQASQFANQGFQNDMARAGMNLDQMNNNRMMGLQEYLGMGNLNLDRDQFKESQNQFQKNYGLDFLRYLAQRQQFSQQLGQNQGQFEDSMGLNWAQHQASQANNFLNYMFAGQQGQGY